MNNCKWALAQWGERRWWRNYLRNKPVGKYLEAKKAYWFRVLKTIELEVPAEASVLDVGCGPAGIFMVLSGNVSAVDPLLAIYERELDHFDPNWYPGVRFEPHPFEKYQPDQSFDYIFCLNAINHFSNWELSIHRLFDLLNPGGKLLLGADMHKWQGLKALFRTLPGDLLHPHQHQLGDYEHQLNAVGFCIRQTRLLKKGRIFDYIAILAERPRVE